ncbi:MAG: hypothetical protein PHI66_01315 [Candidatus Pacebacteria bacterium]|nr:hypothetical protein [Candidatus Paceibacterota bacterium]
MTIIAEILGLYLCIYQKRIKAVKEFITKILNLDEFKTKYLELLKEERSSTNEATQTEIKKQRIGLIESISI